MPPRGNLWVVRRQFGTACDRTAGMLFFLLRIYAVAIFCVCCFGCGPCGQRACVVHKSTSLSAAASIVFEEAMELSTGRIEVTLLLFGPAVGDQRSTFVIQG